MSDLDAMLKRAAQHKMTPAEEHAQRRSWAIGQMMLSHPEMTREEAERLADGAVGPNYAARVAELEADNTVLRDALAWYGEQARLCRLIHSEGDAGRQALDADGGTRAQVALARPRPTAPATEQGEGIKPHP